jgi:uncharacterized membrane protein YidH (DUF202 family)
MFVYAIRPQLTEDMTATFNRIFEDHESIMVVAEKGLRLLNKETLSKWFQPTKSIVNHNKRIMITLYVILGVTFVVWIVSVVYAYLIQCNGIMWFRTIISVITFGMIGVVQYLIFQYIFKQYRLIDEKSASLIVLQAVSDSLRARKKDLNNS